MRQKSGISYLPISTLSNVHNACMNISGHISEHVTLLNIFICHFFVVDPLNRERDPCDNSYLIIQTIQFSTLAYMDIRIWQFCRIKTLNMYKK